MSRSRMAHASRSRWIGGAMAAGAVLLIATGSWASSPESKPGVDASQGKSPAGAGATAGVSGSALPSPEELRRRMEAAMEKVGDAASEARAQRDLVRVACVRDKQERAADVLALGTGELLIVRDQGAAEQARGFAHEKLLAAAEQLERIVEEARRCAGDEGPEADDDLTRNEADEPMSIPRNDPTVGFGASPVPPAGADGWPPVSSPYY